MYFEQTREGLKELYKEAVRSVSVQGEKSITKQFNKLLDILTCQVPPKSNSKISLDFIISC